MKREAAHGDERRQALTSALEDMRRHLRLRYVRMLAAPAAILVVVESARMLGHFSSLPYVDHPTWDVVLFVLAACTAVALPLLYRVLFARAHRQDAVVSFSAFYRFQHTSTRIALYTAWIAAAASLIAVSGIHHAGIFLMTLYAAYVFFPSARRITSDARIFRVQPPGRADRADVRTEHVPPEQVP
ncbi:MAG: hypothetical protein RBU27_04420 [Bacteroidota bacterium]|jgi:hypothetical protein|nr:hypothetical protein [Bacteroidota bacterium]